MEKQCRDIRLSDVGEIDLLRQYVQPYLRISCEDVNNDCVTAFETCGKYLIWTIDPTPVPVAWLLGIHSPEMLGWYSALINLSDIAANGGRPLGIMVSVEMPNETPLDFYLRFNEGLDSLCGKFQCTLLGGNLKSADRFASTGTALGIVEHKNLTRKLSSFSRPGATASIFVIGPTGYFWAAVLARFYSIDTSQELRAMLDEALQYPSPQIKAGELLACLPYEIACMDNSDGLLNCIKQFALLNKVDVEVFPDVRPTSHGVESIYIQCGIEPINGCFAFGDWQLVCMVDQENVADFSDSLRSEGISHYQAGIARTGTGKIASFGTGMQINEQLINQNFTPGFNDCVPAIRLGLDESDDKVYVERLIERYLRQPVFV